MPVMIVLAPPSAGVRFLVKPDGTTTIGRDSSCDITLSKRSLSRHHAQIVPSGKRFYIEDSQSTNGTFVNGHRIHKPTQLQDGDVVNLHDLPLAFSISETASDTETVPLSIDGPIDINDTAHTVPIYSGTPGASILKGRLDSLISAARHLGSTLDPAEVSRRVLELLFQMFPQATLSEVHLADDDDQLCRVGERCGDQMGDTLSGDTVMSTALFDPQVVQDVFASGQGVVHTSSNVEEESVFDEAVVSTICVPIHGGSLRGLGVLVVQTDDGAHTFTQDDLELVSAVGILAGQAIGFSRSHQLLLQHERTQRHLKTARDIQLAMVAHTRPTLSGYQFADHYTPAEKVGGDYYFYEELPDGRVILGIADASGKGLGAAMAIARFAGEVRFQLATAPTLKAAMSFLNCFMAQAGPMTFITCCVCLIDPKVHTVTVANAGHLPPLRRPGGGGTIEMLDTPGGGLPFGIDESSICHPVTFPINPGDRIVLMTDGVTEAMDPDYQIYGNDRLKQAMQADTESLSDWVDSIVGDVDRFRRGRAASDDVCLLAFERLRS